MHGIVIEEPPRRRASFLLGGGKRAKARRPQPEKRGLRANLREHPDVVPFNLFLESGRGRTVEGIHAHGRDAPGTRFRHERSRSGRHIQHVAAAQRREIEGEGPRVFGERAAEEGHRRQFELWCRRGRKGECGHRRTGFGDIK